MTNISHIFIGLFVGVALFFTVDLVVGLHSINENLLITECEKNLPRNQICVLIAVPETSTKVKK